MDARNIDGSTPLCDACASGSIECVKLLLSHGAKVNPPLYTASPLHEACMSGESGGRELCGRDVGAVGCSGLLRVHTGGIVVASPRGPQLSPWTLLAQDWTGFYAQQTLGAFQTLTPETGPRCGLSQCSLSFGPVGPCSSWGTRLRHIPEDRGPQSRGSWSCRVGEQVGFQLPS